MGKWQGMMLGGGAVLVLTGAALMFGAGQASGQETTADVVVFPASQEMTADAAPFEIEIKIANVQNLGAFELSLKYNPEVLDFLGAIGTSWLTTSGRSQACLNAETFPDAGIVKFGCNTLGLIENEIGKPGPNGAGTLAVVAFQPKATGHSDLTLVGMDGWYEFTSLEQTHYAQTTLDSVEVCIVDDCESAPIGINATTGIVAVKAPGAPTSTALPPTPTPEPRASRTPDVRATVRSVFGTPEHTLDDDDNSTTSGSTPIASTQGTLPAQPGDAAGEIVSDPSGQRYRVVETRAGQLRRQPLNRSGVAGAQDGPEAAPVAGFGPGDATTNPWFERSGAFMVLMGAAAIAGGLRTRRRMNA